MRTGAGGGCRGGYRAAAGEGQGKQLVPGLPVQYRRGWRPAQNGFQKELKTTRSIYRGARQAGCVALAAWGWRSAVHSVAGCLARCCWRLGSG